MNFIEKIEELERLCKEYETVYLPKSAFSAEQSVLLSTVYDMKEIRLTPELSETIDNLQDAELDWTQEWHYSFKRLEGDRMLSSEDVLKLNN